MLASVSIVLSQLRDSEPDSVVRPKMESLSNDFFSKACSQGFLKFIVLSSIIFVD